VAPSPVAGTNGTLNAMLDVGSRTGGRAGRTEDERATAATPHEHGGTGTLQNQPTDFRYTHPGYRTVPCQQWRKASATDRSSRPVTLYVRGGARGGKRHGRMTLDQQELVSSAPVTA